MSGKLTQGLMNCFKLSKSACSTTSHICIVAGRAVYAAEVESLQVGFRLQGTTLVQQVCQTSNVSVRRRLFLAGQSEGQETGMRQKAR